MSQDPLQQFARQLHAWSTEELLKKPGPFRTVELFPSLLGKTDNITPPVVFWVNRESHLAGGVILLPKKDLTDVLDSGREICAALGLDCYYTWSLGEVSAWQVGEASGRQWSEPLPSATMQEESRFREVLGLLLENMQNHFFKNQPQLPILSAPYLTNLLHNCIETTLPIILNHDQDEEDGRRTITGVVLQLVSLCSQDLLPAKTSPDHLLTDLKHAAEQLPTPLATVLKQHDASIRLPEPAIIKLHHLYQRLRQHGPALSPFISETVQRLLRLWSTTYDLKPLPAALKKNTSTLIIAPDRYHPEMSVSIEVGAPQLIATTALMRQLQSPDRRHPSQFTDLLDMQTPITIDAVNGTLNNSSRATATEQKKMNALLRYSWPNRQLKLATKSPQWAWRAVHLIGLIQGSPPGILNLPADWLWEPYGEQFFALLSERVALSKINQTDKNHICIEFNRSARNQIAVNSVANGNRLLDNNNNDLTRADLLLALTLPTDIYELIRNGELNPPKDEIQASAAIELFLRSSIGRGLWQTLTPRKPLLDRTKMLAEIIRIGLPLPGEQTLDALAQLARKHDQPDTATIDRELEVWLGSACMSMPAPCFSANVRATSVRLKNNEFEAIAAKLIQSGDILAFPQDYLYKIPEDSRTTYLITGKLNIIETFFNKVTLSSSEGRPVHVEGTATARALQLISNVQTGEVELPDDEQQVNIILDRYLRDLQNLQSMVLQLSVNSGKTTTASLADQVWDILPVPPRDLL